MLPIALLMVLLSGCEVVNQNAAQDVNGLLSDEVTEAVPDETNKDDVPSQVDEVPVDEPEVEVIELTEEEVLFLEFYEMIGDVTYSYVDGEVLEVSNPESLYALANKKNSLPASYVPEGLVIPDVKFSFEGTPDKKYLRPVAAEALELLFAAAIEEEGLYLFGVSGYRSYETQERVFNYNVSQRGEEEANKVSARPGQSEHQTGLTMDVSSQSAGFSLETYFGETPEGLWVADKAHLYGFHIHYLEDKVAQTGYSYEPWHLRYLGVELATYLYESHLTIDEFYEWYDGMLSSGVLDKVGE